MNRLAASWRGNPAIARRAGRAGGGWEYHISALPPATQARLTLMHGHSPAESAEEGSEALWRRFEGLSKKQKQECQRRLGILDQVDQFKAAGMHLTAAVALASSREGVSQATVFNWLSLTYGLPRADRLAALAPRYQATAELAACHPRAWELITSDYLRPEKPSFSRCYRDMRKAASAQGWLPIPSERSLRRRLEAEVPAGVILLARGGKDKAKSLYPAQKRDRTMLHAMQAVNMDGHELDVFVRLDDGTTTRMHLLALQDLYSGKIVAWRLSETENKETVRLVIGDMVELFGIPERIVLDNGRAFTSKWITGQTQTRYRFKIREEDPKGLLVALGVDIRWAKPYSGQSKPIERAFRDLTDSISRHPFCAGAYTGANPLAKPENYASRAIPLAAFSEHVERQIVEHNARPGRRSDTAAGRSFDETFDASMADPSTIVTFPTEAQRALWMLTADTVRAKKGSGEIAFMGNRYWSKELNRHAGRKVVIRFDPGHLHTAVRVYTIDDVFICMAQCVDATGFFDAAAARRHERDRGALLKATAEQLRLHRKMSADELARFYAPQTPAKPAATPPPTVKRLAVGGSRPAPQPETISEEEMEAAFACGLRLVKSDD